MHPISPRNLFSASVLGYQVSTERYGLCRYINLDNAATTPAFARVEAAVHEFMTTYGSVHRGSGTKSQLSTNTYEESRNVIKDFVGAKPSDYVLFTTNTTGGVNTMAHFFSFLQGKVVVSEIEHSSSWLPWVVAEGERSLTSTRVSLSDMPSLNMLIQEKGKQQVVQYPTNEYMEFDLEVIENLLQIHSVKAVVVTAASNATGYRPNIVAIGKLAHRYGAYLVVDGCQYIQHHPIDMQGMGIDFLVASGHKLYAPYGGGFVVGPKDFFDVFLPYQIGGGNLPYITADGTFLRYATQQAHDPGTPNAVGAIAMAAALKVLQELGLGEVEKYETKLTRMVYDALSNNPSIELYVPEKHLSTIVAFTVRKKDPRMVADTLNRRYGIGVRAGSFCVYNAMRRLLHITDETEIIAAVQNGDTRQVPGFIRASFGLCNTAEDAERFICAINELSNQ